MAREKISLPSQPTTFSTLDGAGYTAHNPMQIMPHYRVTIRQEAIVEENRPLLEVVAHLPEEFNLDTQSEYDTPFADGLVSDRRIQTIMQLAGWSPTVQAMTAHFWRGSSPIEINLPLVFYAKDATSNITAELLKLKSLQLPRVDKDTKFLRPPGPRMKLNTEAAKRIFNAAASAASAATGVMTNNAVGSADAQAPGTKIDANESTLDTSMRIGTTFGKEFATAAQDLIEVSGKISIRLGKFLFFSDVVIRSISDAYNVILGPDQRPQQMTVTVSAVTRMTPTYEDLVGATGIYQTDDPLLAAGGQPTTLPGFSTSQQRGTGTDYFSAVKTAANNAIDKVGNLFE